MRSKSIRESIDSPLSQTRCDVTKSLLPLQFVKREVIELAQCYVVGHSAGDGNEENIALPSV